MAAINITNFLGKAPKLASEHLPNTASQVATNCKLYSGNLIPYPQPVVKASTGRTGDIKTLYALRNPDDADDLKWLSWGATVDIVVASSNLQDEQRFYYTGDGVPKISNYSLATAGAGPYPTNYYDLGLPLPDDEDTLTTTYEEFTTKDTVSFARDASNIATIVTSEPHKLRTGNAVTVTGITYLDGTYTQGGSARIGLYTQVAGSTTNTITISAHGLTTGDKADLRFAAHPGVGGVYAITVVDTNTFTITMLDTTARSGAVTYLVNASTTTTTETFSYSRAARSSVIRLDIRLGADFWSTHKWAVSRETVYVTLTFDNHAVYNGAYLARIIDASTIEIDTAVAPPAAVQSGTATCTNYEGVYKTGYRTGTYRQEDDCLSCTITIVDHGLDNGTIVDLAFSNHDSMNGIYSATVASKDTFAVTLKDDGPRTGTITWKNPGNAILNVLISGHGLKEGGEAQLEFTSGTASDGPFTAVDVLPDSFNIVTNRVLSGGGTVKLSHKAFNVTSAECTVIDDYTFTYFSPGPEVAEYAYTRGKVDLGGLTQARTYVYTWRTPWGEESVASRPSETLYIKEGVIVTVSDIPTAKPEGNNFVRGVSLYRTLPTAKEAEYFLLTTLWFPTAVSSVARTSGVASVTLAHPHNLGIGDRVKITGCSVSAFNVTDAKVTDIPTDYTFEFEQAGADVALTPTTSGTLYHDIAEDAYKDDAVYWGETTYNFVDTFDSKALTDVLGSDEYDPPPDRLEGLTAIQNGLLVGFVGNTLFFSEPDLPHAWPKSYATHLAYDIVALAALSGSLLVLTKGYPYLISVTDPAAGISVSRIDALYPCLSASSVVTMGYGTVWATNDGLALYSPSSGAAIITKPLYNNDAWTMDFDPTTVVAEYYGENYFASHSTGAFIFEQDQKVGGFFVDADVTFTASWYDALTGKLYLVTGTDGDIYEWDNLAQPHLRLEWKSKTILTKDMINLGAARVIADYAQVMESQVWNLDTLYWEDQTTLWDAADGVLFTLWAGKQEIFSTVLSSSEMFRLPTGYRTDTFEVGVAGTLRVRSIHLAETPLGLKEA